MGGKGENLLIPRRIVLAVYQVLQIQFYFFEADPVVIEALRQSRFKSSFLCFLARERALRQDS
ncbi:hypothetical protein B4O97_18655 [Marispirochaeta aestuarii]|uniref:Uncharacterized protein n=1 Tax=Marispirochaeta aestuarii TaxID=1963862 RepID=A0A1Y1RU70_9SPIO|nr:hypothetical protein [Marispirochaeta aestuarii]ORC29904.1 hypothetical protein B4O97_18655 [Marispirochaeta aestuarii]